MSLQSAFADGACRVVVGYQYIYGTDPVQTLYDGSMSLGDSQTITDPNFPSESITLAVSDDGIVSLTSTNDYTGFGALFSVDVTPTDGDSAQIVDVTSHTQGAVNARVDGSATTALGSPGLVGYWTPNPYVYDSMPTTMGIDATFPGT